MRSDILGHVPKPIEFSLGATAKINARGVDRVQPFPGGATPVGADLGALEVMPVGTDLGNSLNEQIGGERLRLRTGISLVVTWHGFLGVFGQPCSLHRLSLN